MSLDIPDKYITQILTELETFPNDTKDFAKPHLRKSVATVYPLFVVLYSCLVVFGSALNTCMIVHIIRKRLHHDPSCAYIMNIGFCNIVICILVLPISLAILLIQNWIFGSFLCYFVPMIQVRQL